MFQRKLKFHHSRNNVQITKYFKQPLYLPSDLLGTKE